MGIGIDCFAYIGPAEFRGESCKALSECYCRKGICAFYKPHDPREAELRSAEMRDYIKTKQKVVSV